MTILQKPAVDSNDDITDFPANNNNSNLFRFKQQITGQTGNGSTKDLEIMIPLKYLSNFWRALEMLLSNFDITLPLIFSTKSILVAAAAANQARKLRITNTKLYVPAVTISTQENIKLTRKQNNWNIVLKKQIIGINIIFKKQIRLETDIQIF